MPREFTVIFYGIYVIFGKKNQRKMVPEGPTSQAGAPYPPRRAGVACGQPLGRLVPFFRRKKTNFWRKIMWKFQPDRSYGSLWVDKTVKPPRFQRRETDRKFQDPISGEALAPGRPKIPWTRGGNLLPSRGRPSKKKKEGASLPLSPGGAGVSPGEPSWRRSSPTTSPPSSPSFPLFVQRCTLSLSPLYNLYLNMVLDHIYYYPMMCCTSIMFE